MGLWIHDGRNYIQPASDKHVEQFKNEGTVDYGPAGSKPMKFQLKERSEWEHIPCKKGPPIPVKEIFKEIMGGTKTSIP